MFIKLMYLSSIVKLININSQRLFMIRKLTQKEIPFIAKHYEKIMREQFKKIGETPITKGKYENILKENFKDSFMFVLDEKEIKAFIWFVKEGDEINLEEIFSIEKERGHGKRLINFLINYAKNKKIKKINIDVHFRNNKALTFFKSFGFTERTIELSLDI